MKSSGLFSLTLAACLISSVALAENNIACPSVKSIQDNALLLDTVVTDSYNGPLSDLGNIGEGSIVASSPMTLNKNDWYLVTVSPDTNATNDVQLQGAQQETKTITTLQLKYDIQDFSSGSHIIYCIYTVQKNNPDYTKDWVDAIYYKKGTGPQSKTAPQLPMMH